MARPTRPLLTRDRVVAAATSIIDTEGLAACSLPRLAKEFGVKTPSLYHHFTDRAEIMAEVARAIVLETVVPRKPAADEWIEWFVQLAVNFRRTILRHPNAAPVLLQHLPRDLTRTLYDSAARYLKQTDVPHDVHVLILDGLDVMTLGAGLTQAMRPPNLRTELFPGIDPDLEPHLSEAVVANPWPNSQEVFAQAVRAYLEGVIAGHPYHPEPRGNGAQPA